VRCLVERMGVGHDCPGWLPAAGEAWPRGEKALQVTSIPLVAFGLGNAIHFIWAGRKHRGRPRWRNGGYVTIVKVSDRGCE
jgi:hypothetical protein